MTATDEPRLDHDARCAIWHGADVTTGCTCHDDQGHAPRTPWADGPWLAFDLETTGVDVTRDRIVTATVIVHTPGADLITHTWLADPGVDIPAAATEVHGVSTEHAREHGRPAATVVTEVGETLATHWTREVPLIGFNVSYDLSLLDAELVRHTGSGLSLAGPVVDPRIIDKQVDRYRRGSRKLVDVCAHYRVRLDGAHDATADALAAARVAWRIAKDHPAIGGALLEDLHRQQVAWFAGQQRSFAGYLRRTARNQTDEDERRKLLERADQVEADADGWPLREDVVKRRRVRLVLSVEVDLDAWAADHANGDDLGVRELRDDVRRYLFDHVTHAPAVTDGAILNVGWDR